MFTFSKDSWRENSQRLTNQIFKILPMFENKEDWQKQQRTLILELKGLNDVFSNQKNFMILVSKLYALDYAEDQFEFRKLIFETLSALKEIEV